MRVKSCFPTALHPPGRRPHPNPPPEGEGTIKRPWRLSWPIESTCSGVTPLTLSLWFDRLTTSGFPLTIEGPVHPAVYPELVDGQAHHERIPLRRQFEAQYAIPSPNQREREVSFETFGLRWCLSCSPNSAAGRGRWKRTNQSPGVRFGRRRIWERYIRE